MEPIGENEQFEWDGLRRRRTISSAGDSRGGSVRRQKTVHPPLGMSRFPDDVSEPDSEVHPGFFGRIGRRPASKQSDGASVPLSNVSPTREGRDRAYSSRKSSLRNTVRAIEEEEEDTSYKSPAGAESQHVRWAHADSVRDRASSKSSSQYPPPNPPGARRQFSFQNPFNRRRDGDEQDEKRATSSGGRSATHSFMERTKEYPAGNNTTEEERLGLVHGDSSKATLPRYTEMEDARSRDRSDSDEWQVTSGTSSSPEQITHGDAADLGRQQRRRDTYDDEYDDMYDMPLQSPAGESPSRRPLPGSKGAFI